METTLLIDSEAKTKIPLIKVPKDSAGNPYFIGKIQWPGVMDFEHGISFMVFVAENGMEELQIAPADPSRISKINKDLYLNHGKFCIDIHPMIDQNGSIYYVGEAIGFQKIDVRQGLFFTIYTSIVGQEQIQIGRLHVKARKKYDVGVKTRSNTFDPKHYE